MRPGEGNQQDDSTGRGSCSSSSTHDWGIPTLGEPKTAAANRTIVLDPGFTADHRPWPANPQYVSALFRREVERADLPAVRSHNLRHTAASLQVAEGVPLPVVAERLGHSSAAVTLPIREGVAGSGEGGGRASRGSSGRTGRSGPVRGLRASRCPNRQS